MNHRDLLHLGIQARINQLQDELTELTGFLKANNGHPANIDKPLTRPRGKLPHWTQRPENKAKLIKMARRSARTRHAQEKNA